MLYFLTRLLKSIINSFSKTNEHITTTIVHEKSPDVSR
jgi:hypothetical protein